MFTRSLRRVGIMGAALLVMGAGMAAAAVASTDAKPAPHGSFQLTTDTIPSNPIVDLNNRRRVKPGKTIHVTSGTITQVEDWSAKPATLAPLTTDRPIVAVGTLLEIEPTSGRLRLAIERNASRLPNRLKQQARELKQTTAVLEREFPAQRTYRIERSTQAFDARPREGVVREARAEDGKIQEDVRRLKLSAFTVGDRVSVLYLMPTGDEPPRVLNLSKLEHGQQIVSADFNPVGGLLRKHVETYSDGVTTHTRTTMTLNRDPAAQKLP